MKRLKLLPVLVMLTVLLFTSIGQVVASSAFNDVNRSHWASEEIIKLYKKGIISGYKNGNFLPDEEITRGETAVLIARALNLDTKNVKAPNFKDVDNNFYAYNAIAAVSEAGIMNGADNQFLPKKSLTRAEMAELLVKAFQLKANGEVSFNDVSKDNWAYNSINIVASNGFVKGYEDGTFQPNREISRAEFTALLSRVLGDEESELKQLLKEVYYNELELKSYDMTSNMKLDIRLPNSLIELEPELAMFASVLQDIELKMDTVYQLDPMVMEMDLSVVLGGSLNTTLDMPIVITEEKMLMKLPDNPLFPLPEEVKGKFIEMDLAELEEMSGGVGVGGGVNGVGFTSNMTLEKELAKALYDIVIEHFTDAFYELADLDTVTYSESIDAKHVVKFEMTNDDLKRFLIILVEDFLPEFIDLMDDPKYVEALGMDQEMLTLMKQELATIQTEVIGAIEQIQQVVNIKELNVYSVINKDNIIEQNTMNLDFDLNLDNETVGIGIYATDVKKNINETPKFKYNNINKQEIVSFTDLLMVE